LEDLDIGKCVGCGAGLISVSEICPQCGLPKSKGAELEEAEKKVANDIELDESEEKQNNVEIENYEEFVEKVADKIKSNSSTKKTC